MKTKTNSTQRIAITGGPCVGKSTLAEILSERGFPIVPEAARIIIEREQAKDSDCLPWKNLQKFQNAVSNTQYELENQYTDRIVISDRGIVDGYAYSKLDGINVPQVIFDHGRNRYDFVFLLDQLDNYQKDESRREDKETANLIQAKIKETYEKFGYNPVRVPVLPPQERADFVIKTIGGVD